MRLKYQPEKGWGRRNIFCGSYAKCLDLAIKRFWEQWHCHNCQQCENVEAAPELMLSINDAIPYYEFVH